MNAAEIIEQIKHLPLEEQGKVVAFTRHLPNEETLEAMAEPIEELSRYKNMDEVRSAIKDLVNHA
jgi:hypothetical protein